MPNRLLIDFEIINFINNRFNFILFLDFFSIIFLITVILISIRVFTFRRSYIRGDKYFKRFHYLLLSFVVSIVILILSPNLVRILLGWDGLGISSYLLVIYYSRSKSYNAGIITILRNRVGDALILISLISLLFINNLNIFLIFYLLKLNYYWVFILLVIAGCTKRAQIPFRAWLPAAIAAPTPVSSLVHSSTLVTAGVYLIFRFENLLILININKFLLLLGCLTIFIARFRAFFEIDIKKIVALSTLSQLGVIITRLGAGFRILGFFHLLSHAFFKALLFVSAGNLIHRSESYQDLRVIGGNTEVIPFRKRIVIGSSLSLCGLPFISAFYSKEIIIERLLIYNLPFYSYFLIAAGVFITVFYSSRFLILSLTWFSRQRSLFNKSDLDSTVNYRILILLSPAILGGAVIRQKLASSHALLLISRNLKYFILLLILLAAILFYIFNLNIIILYNKIFWRLRRLWGLPFFSARAPIIVRMNLGDYFHKISDFSWIYFIFTNFILNKFKFQNIIGITFLRINFIRAINNIFIIFLFILVLFY